MNHSHKCRPVMERIMEKVNKDGPLWNGTPCWEYKGALSHGYGRISVPPCKNAAVHRVVYQSLVGTLPARIELDHLCKNTRCCNPAHLEPKTHSVHMKKNKKDRCINGHLRTAENTIYLRNGKRKCLICKRIQEKARYHKNIEYRREYARKLWRERH